MPNHVYTALVINGTPEDLDALWTRLNPQPSKEDPEVLTCDLFQTLKPMPEEYKGTTADFGKTQYPELMAKYGANDWYDWCNRNWGTKWGDYETVISREEKRILITFSTAWTCPVEFYQEHLNNFKLRAIEEGIESLTEADESSETYIRSPKGFLLKWARERGDTREYKEYEDFCRLAEEWVNALVEGEE